MTHDVFLSHSSKDKTAADAVCAGLEAGGIGVWMAPRDIVPGVDYGESIIDAIEASRVLVVLLSAQSVASHQVVREVERAASKSIPIVPLRIEDVLPSRSLEFYLGTAHRLDALTPPIEQHMGKIVASVRALLARRGQRAGESALPNAEPTPPVDTRPRVPCPECAELILADAKRCRHCHADLTRPSARPTFAPAEEAPSHERRAEATAPRQPASPPLRKVTPVSTAPQSFGWKWPAVIVGVVVLLVLVAKAMFSGSREEAPAADTAAPAMMPAPSTTPAPATTDTGMKMDSSAMKKLDDDTMKKRP